MEQSVATSQIFNADCLEKMKDLDDDSVDLIFCDLPYNQTSCAWDKAVLDLEQFWIQVMRIKKLHTPIFFTTTTKFGVSLIQSAPKKCFFRYDLVWVKSAPAGFLSAKKMPMRKHEMIYVFYEKLPFYDLSSHKHKFIKEVPTKRDGKDGLDNKGMIKNRSKSGMETQTKYDPPLPVSVVKQEDSNIIDGETYNTKNRKKPITREPADKYNPPLPVSVVKEELCKYDVNKNTYGGGKEGRIKIPKDKKYHEAKYDPPLPVSVVKQVEYKKTTYGSITIPEIKERKMGESRYDPALPVSVVKEDVRKDKHTTAYGTNIHHHNNEQKNGESIYNPPLPTTMLEIKSTRGKHSTEKPVALMEWIFKYYSKEGDVILDPTCGSGSTGVACKNMNRNFIGIEMDEDIFKVAQERLK